MNDMRELLADAEQIALSWIAIAKENKYPGPLDKIEAVAFGLHEALAAPKWTFPDEDTPDEAGVWMITRTGAAYHRQWHEVRMFESCTFVLTRTGEGPPNEEETRQIMERVDEI